VTGDHPMLSGYAEADLPSVLGYVMTEPKPATQVLLAAETGDPLLAVGRFGLGQGLAWTADLSERWGGEWLAWDGCGKFWAQVLRAVVRKNDADGLDVRSSLEGEVMKLEISRKDNNGTPVTNVNWDAQAIDENGKPLPVNITPTGLGRYQASVPLTGKEKLTVRVRDTDSDKVKVLNYNRPTPPEYRLSQKLPNELTSLPNFSANSIRQEIKPVTTRQPLDTILYFLALGCALGSVLLRRV
jgi:Ca-activated chloride channel homolog